MDIKCEMDNSTFSNVDDSAGPSHSQAGVGQAQDVLGKEQRRYIKEKNKEIAQRRTLAKATMSKKQYRKEKRIIKEEKVKFKKEMGLPDRRLKQTPHSHPPHLKGRAIGMWYASQAKKRKKDGIGNENEGINEKREKRDIGDRAVVAMEEQDEAYLKTLISKVECGSNDTLQYSNESVSNVKQEPDFDYFSYGSRGLYRCEALDNELYDNLQKRCNTLTGRDLENYRKISSFRTQLPSYKMQKEILEMVWNNQVLLISGATGCGKTTQVAQFILDDCIQRKCGSTCHIICTQPRRISAISVAQRVAAERGECLGKSCGYEIRLEKDLPRKQGSILYCTLGILLRFMISDPSVSQASHIIVDEIHERDTLSDFLLIILKDLLQIRPDIKVILMSATLNANLFSKYFDNCPRLEIPGTAYEVQDHYLEDYMNRLSYSPGELVLKKRKGKWGKIKSNAAEFNSYLQSIQEHYSPYVIQKLRNVDFVYIDVDLVISVVQMICETSDDGAILIFLPGWNDISNVNKAFHDNPIFSNPSEFILIPLHSKLPTVSQREVFDRPPLGCRKIIMSTNIAETSITIDDVVFVINCGKDKETNYDMELNVTSLDATWNSRASEQQRRGRAGRVQNGHCFHLFTKWHQAQFRDFQLPEMRRTKLDSLSLQIKILKLGKIWEFLQKAIEPPSYEMCNLAVKELTRMRALDQNENLTSLGYYLAVLPVNPKIGRMILFGAMFSCLDPILTVAGGLESKDPFVTPMGKEAEADKKKCELSDDSKSDHIALINAFYGWKNLEGKPGQSQFCWENFLSHNHLKFIDGTKKQFAQLLNGIGFLNSSNPVDSNHNVHSCDEKLVKAVICAGLYPNVAKIHLDKKGTFVRYIQSIEDGKKPIKVSLHPKSVNSKTADFDSEFLTYHEKMRVNNTIYLFDSTMVSPYSLLFFGGSIRYHEEMGHETVEVDKGIKFHASFKTARLIINMREQVDKLLEEKIRDPQMPLIAGVKCEDEQQLGQGQKILNAVIELISREEINPKRDQSSSDAP